MEPQDSYEERKERKKMRREEKEKKPGVYAVGCASGVHNLLNTHGFPDLVKSEKKIQTC